MRQREALLDLDALNRINAVLHIEYVGAIADDQVGQVAGSGEIVDGDGGGHCGREAVEWVEAAAKLWAAGGVGVSGKSGSLVEQVRGVPACDRLPEVFAAGMNEPAFFQEMVENLQPG